MGPQGSEMESLFDGATAFNQDIGNWDLGKTTDLECMLNGASAFNKPIGNGNSMERLRSTRTSASGMWER